MRREGGGGGGLLLWTSHLNMFRLCDVSCHMTELPVSGGGGCWRVTVSVSADGWMKLRLHHWLFFSKIDFLR